jgi:hypothetical protein
MGAVLKVMMKAGLNCSNNTIPLVIDSGKALHFDSCFCYPNVSLSYRYLFLLLLRRATRRGDRATRVYAPILIFCFLL